MYFDAEIFQYLEKLSYEGSDSYFGEISGHLTSFVCVEGQDLSDSLEVFFGLFRIFRIPARYFAV